MSIPKCTPKKLDRKREHSPEHPFRPYKKPKIGGEGLVDGELPLFPELPEEIQLHIFGFLSWPYEPMIAREVCRDWWGIIPFDLEKVAVFNSHGMIAKLPCVRHGDDAHSVSFSERGDIFFWDLIHKNNVSILERYFGNRFISPGMLKLLSNEVPVEMYTLPLMKWLHLRKNMVISNYLARCIVKHGDLELALWVCECHQVVVTKDVGNGIGLMLQSLYKVYNGLKWAIESNHTELWDRVWNWLWDNSRFLLVKPRELTKVSTKNMFWKLTKRALRHGFSHAIQELLATISPKREGVPFRHHVSGPWGSEEAASLMGMLSASYLLGLHACDLMKEAFTGNDITCIETLYEAMDANTQRGALSAPHDLLGIVINQNALVPYKWLLANTNLRDAMPISEEVGQTENDIVRMIEKHGAKCATLLSSLLSDISALVEAFNREWVEKAGYIHRSDKILSDIYSRGLHEVLGVFYDHQCLVPIGKRDLTLAQDIISGDYGKHNDMKSYMKTLHMVCTAYGLKRPATWKLHTDNIYTWK